MRDFAAELEERKQAGLYRTRRQISGPQQPALVSDGVPLLSFCSNDYLGLANHPGIIKAATEAMPNTGFGGAASHLICGHHDAHHQLELRLAEFTRRSAALFFSTGYMANMGVISALAGRGDTIFSDRLNHASIIDGCVLSRARVRRYRHGDMSALADMLAATGGHKLVVTDGVFSMDGDIAPLRELAALCRAHEALLVVDDAHGLGVLGPQGRGSLMEQGLSEEDVPILIGTLGKAVGTSGAFVAGPQLLMDYLVQKARTYIYTTAMPPAIALATCASFDLIEREDSRRSHLQMLISEFRQEASALGYELMPSRTPIQPILVGDNWAALALSQALEERGLMVTAIRPPTVPEGQARLRVTFSAAHSSEDLAMLLSALADCRSLLNRPSAEVV
ncbi:MULTISPECIES: 8-amino-7-oxononanoate synthase [Marinobacter]|jgi:8-amino-7-oxononanoate synthase|uniref:8-amino-7-oxononanoate synthase n=1 Tax=Marinobacter salarius TaxID=1420917 RepID=A0ABY1FHZ6_9GAMM|nr:MULTISPECIES: 8-amino-7-oxononanoate synthase [Marinobacter]KXJ43236.1 MAG: 8-amino-7-oxononanoate synthase [Marinobacter sp. Hex_13]OLF82231.1 8-amino-7-oxononanoate synthase [Marinobacter sp. C18]SFL39791.1 8-amino-7-oxononanoate synthase [Marinobacter salarius]|tara:strand:- start:14122 stop:15300 length:1179 start_codon:yes stop_codon:yes gene_type:complete